MTDQFPQKITQDTSLTFIVKEFGLYAIFITARCKPAKQSESKKNETLRAEIDDTKLREIPPLDKPQYNKIPPTWNGTDQQGLSKTVIFIVTLNKGQHALNLFPTNGSVIEEWSYQKIESTQEVSLALEKQAENGDKRSWHTFALVDVPLQSLIAEVSTSWHFWDGDNIKLIIDGKINQNSSSKLWRNWLWSARPWQLLSGPKKEKNSIELNLPQGIHYIEFWAEKTPTLHRVVFNFGDFHPKRVPTVSDPQWTGDFADDTDQMILARLLFGEARNQSMDTMTGIGFVITNRLIANKRYFGSSYHEIILKNVNGIYQFSSFRPSDPNYQLLIDPMSENADFLTKQAWFLAYDVANRVISGDIPDSTKGATYFHSDDLSQEIFVTDRVPGAIFTKQIGNFLFYRDPNDT